MSKKLKIKDLVTIGIFFVIFYVIYFVVGFINFYPQLGLLWPTGVGIFAGVPMMLFMAKVQKPYAFLILGMLPHIVNVILGYHYIVLIIALVFVGAGELIRRKGEYKSFKSNAIAYGLFAASLSSGLMQLLLVRDHYVAMMQSSGNDMSAYISALDSVLSPLTISLVILGGFLGGLIGAFIGKAMLKKHFEKAGII